MAQEIVTWCDRCMDDDKRTPGTARFISLDGKKLFTADLCEPCDKEILQPVRDLLAEFGRPADSSSVPPINVGKKRRTKDDMPADQRVNCPFEGCTHQVMRRTTLRDHLMIGHNTTLAVVEGERGVTVDGEKIRFYCEVAGCKAGFTTAQGRGAHAHAEHQLPGTSKGASSSKKTTKKPAKKAS